VQATRYQQIKAIFGAALEHPTEERTAFLDTACGGDADLRSEVDRLLAAYVAGTGQGFYPATPPPASWFDADETWLESRVGERLGAYQLEAVRGVGGMGVVYRARRADEEFDKRVAVKLVRATPGLPPTELARRLRHERQILASLDHPNIAHVLDGGTTADGLPYVVMDYVEGDPIDSFCDQQRLTIEERLRLFSTVCLAVQHAHQHLVVHRDLKPGNILVTPEGTPILLDFGIATALTAEAAAGLHLTRTVDGRGPLTVAYASPEQVRGAPITTASDVYGLGLILYELLTSHPAYRLSSDSLLEAERVICQAEPLRPSTAVSQEFPGTDSSAAAEERAAARGSTPARLRRQLAGDLDQIVLTALRKEPARRYASAAALAEDIQRYLDGLPVRARPDTAVYRTGKFVRRHLAGVAAAALLLCSLIGGLAATRSQAVQAVQQQEIAEAQQAIAEAQRARAEQRFNEVRELARGLMYELHDSIARVPGATETRALLIAKASAYLDSLAREAGDDRSLLRELSESYTRLGDVQGWIGSPNLGDTAAALASYQRALDLINQLQAADGTDDRSRADLARVLVVVGDLYLRMNNLDAARDAYEHALLVRTGLAEAAPGDPERQLDLAHAHGKSADALLRRGDVGGSLARTEHALVLQTAVVGDDLAQTPQIAVGDDVSRRGWRDLAGSYDRLRLILSRTNATERLLANDRRALAIREQLVAAFPDEWLLRRDLAGAYANLGHTLTKVGEMDAALEHFRESVQIRAVLVAADPRDLRAEDELHDASQTLADILAVTGNLGEAVRVHRRTLDGRRRLSAVDPANVSAQRELGFSFERLGDILWKAGDSAEALTIYREGLAHREALLATAPQALLQRRDMASHLLRFGELLVSTGDADGAISSFQRAAAVLQRLADEDPTDAAARADWGNSLRGIGDGLFLRGDLPMTLEHYQQALWVHEREAAADPENGDLRRELAADHHRIGVALMQSGDLEGALASHERGLALRETSARSRSSDHRLRRDLAESLNHVGTLLGRTGDLQRAQDAHERALRVQEVLSADPADAVVRRGMSQSHEALADLRARQGHADAAREHSLQAIALRVSLAETDPANIELQHNVDGFSARFSESEATARAGPAP
jgi:non-specific serine/threonine protein kinase/serine/threonine-protein kinase